MTPLTPSLDSSSRTASGVPVRAGKVPQWPPITFGARISSDSEVVFEVEDHGRGIPPEKLEIIFERFQQVDASDSRDMGGTGLGLAICRAIVQQHGGHIWAESTPSLGSTFSFTVPRYRPN